jgi:hypothetical protein
MNLFNQWNSMSDVHIVCKEKQHRLLLLAAKNVESGLAS